MEQEIKLKPINQKVVNLTVEGISPIIQHQWDEKAARMMRDKKAGKKTKERSICDPEAEFMAATYRMPDGGYAVPVTAIKGAIISAAHKDIGIEKTLVRKAVFIRAAPHQMIPMTCSEPRMREDHVRVGNNSADLRYRPEFQQWEVPLTIDIDAELLTVEDLINLINRAGFGVGIGDWRPEKGGDFGRFRVKEEAGVQVESR